jgi:hypothetical protein
MIPASAMGLLVFESGLVKKPRNNMRKHYETLSDVFKSIGQQETVPKISESKIGSPKENRPPRV